MAKPTLRDLMALKAMRKREEEDEFDQRVYERDLAQTPIYGDDPDKESKIRSVWDERIREREAEDLEAKRRIGPPPIEYEGAEPGTEAYRLQQGTPVQRFESQGKKFKDKPQGLGGTYTPEDRIAWEAYVIATHFGDSDPRTRNVREQIKDKMEFFGDPVDSSPERQSEYEEKVKVAEQRQTKDISNLNFFMGKWDKLAKTHENVQRRIESKTKTEEKKTVDMHKAYRDLEDDQLKLQKDYNKALKSRDEYASPDLIKSLDAQMDALKRQMEINDSRMKEIERDYMVTPGSTFKGDKPVKGRKVSGKSLDRPETPEEVRTAFRNGQITREQAKQLISGMGGIKK